MPEPTMELHSDCFDAGDMLKSEYAFAKIAMEGHQEFAANKNPSLHWDGAPEGTRSFALVCVDNDVPADASDVNNEDKMLAEDLERTAFYHWLMVNIPADVARIDKAACSDGVEPHGKKGPDGPIGSRQGLNDYTDFLEDDESMCGHYFGYDGPCPPWNDERMHHYHFRLYALDVARLDLEPHFRGPDVLAAIKGHVLAQAELTCRYTLNPTLL